MTLAMSVCKHGHDPYATFTECPKCAVEAEAEAVRQSAERYAQAEREKIIARRKKQRPMQEAIVSAVIAAGSTAELKDDGVFFVNGQRVDLDITFRDELVGTTWNKKPTGRYKITIGDYGNRQTYKPLNNGGYNYVSIAERLISIARSRNEREERQSNSKANSVLAEKFNKRHKIDRYGNLEVTGSDTDKKPLLVKFKITRYMSVTEAEELYKLLQPLVTHVKELEASDE